MVAQEARTHLLILLPLRGPTISPGKPVWKTRVPLGPGRLGKVTLRPGEQARLVKG